MVSREERQGELSSLEWGEKHFRSQEAAGSAVAGRTLKLGQPCPESRLCSQMTSEFLLKRK